MPWRYVPISLNEGHLIDLAHRCNSKFSFCEATFAQSDHTVVAGDALDFRSRSSVNNHLANPVGKVEQFADRCAPVVPGTRTFQATGAFTELGGLRGFCLKPCFTNFVDGKLLGALTIRTDDAYQALRHNAIQRGNEVIGFHTHVNE